MELSITRFDDLRNGGMARAQLLTSSISTQKKTKINFQLHFTIRDNDDSQLNADQLRLQHPAMENRSIIFYFPSLFEDRVNADAAKIKWPPKSHYRRIAAQLVARMIVDNKRMLTKNFRSED